MVLCHLDSRVVCFEFILLKDQLFEDDLQESIRAERDRERLRFKNVRRNAIDGQLD